MYSMCMYLYVMYIKLCMFVCTIYMYVMYICMYVQYVYMYVLLKIVNMLFTCTLCHSVFGYSAHVLSISGSCSDLLT